MQFDKNMKNWCAFLIVTGGMLICPLQGSAAIIQGTINLPEGITAPTGGLEVTIDYDHNSGWDSTQVIIPPGGTSIPYVLDTLDSASTSTGRIAVSLYTPTDTLPGGLLTGLYYASAGMTWDTCSADVINNQDQVIDLNLVTGNIISGSVALPSGDTNTYVSPMSIWVKVEGHKGESDYADSGYVYIEPSESSATYSITVPSDIDTITVRYGDSWSDDDLRSAPTKPYVKTGLYSTAGTLYDFDYEKATTLAAGEDHSNINLTLLSGTRISGTVNIPSSLTSEDGWVTVRANYPEWGIYLGSFITKVSEGTSSLPFVLSISPDPKNEFYISSRFSYSDPLLCSAQLLRMSYYTPGNMTWSPKMATSFPANVPQTDIIISPLKGSRFTGTVSGTAAPLGTGKDINIYLIGINDSIDFSASDDFTLTDEESSNDFCFIGPMDSTATLLLGFTVSTLVEGEYGFSSELPTDIITPAFYAGADTTYMYSKAMPLAGGSDQANLDMVLIPGAMSTIEGSIYLPPGQTAPEPAGYNGHLTSGPKNSFPGVYSSLSFNIAPGETSATFSLPVSPDPSNPQILDAWVGSANYCETAPFVMYSYYKSTCYENKATPVAAGTTGLIYPIPEKCDSLNPYTLFMPAILAPKE